MDRTVLTEKALLNELGNPAEACPSIKDGSESKTLKPGNYEGLIFTEDTMVSSFCQKSRLYLRFDKPILFRPKGLKLAEVPLPAGINYWPQNRYKIFEPTKPFIFNGTKLPLGTKLYFREGMSFVVLTSDMKVKKQLLKALTPYQYENGTFKEPSDIVGNLDFCDPYYTKHDLHAVKEIKNDVVSIDPTKSFNSSFSSIITVIGELGTSYAFYLSTENGLDTYKLANANIGKTLGYLQAPYNIGTIEKLALKEIPMPKRTVSGQQPNPTASIPPLLKREAHFKKRELIIEECEDWPANEDLPCKIGRPKRTITKVEGDQELLKVIAGHDKFYFSNGNFVTLYGSWHFMPDQNFSFRLISNGRAGYIVEVVKPDSKESKYQIIWPFDSTAREQEDAMAGLDGCG